MKKSYEVLKKAVEAKGAKSIASDLGLSSALVYKWCQEPKQSVSDTESSGAANPLDRIQKLCMSTQSEEIIHWICEMGDGFFVKNPKKQSVPADLKIFNHTQEMVHEFSETLKVISDAFTDDRKISKNESEKIRKEWEDLKRAGESFVNACELGRFHKS